MALRRGRRRFVDQWVGPLEAEGDGFAAAGELVTLVVSSPVQQFLGMTAAEIGAADRIVRNYRNAVSALYADVNQPPPDPGDIRRAARQAAEELRELLGVDRFDRLRALSWRLLDGDALLDSDVAARLDLSPRQRADLAAQAETNEREVAAIFEELKRARLANVDELHDRAAAEDALRSRRLLDLLSPQQRRQFERLLTETPAIGDDADDDAKSR